ncbi:MAG: DUF2170 family protein [Mariprofundales bacterium]
MCDRRLAEIAAILNSEVDDTLYCQTTNNDNNSEALQVIVQDRDEFPIFIMADDDQILCITHLFREDEIIADKRLSLLEDMLTMNLPLPLSSFGKVGDQYILFGAMATTSGAAEVRHEIATLSDNTISGIDAFRAYLR